MFNITAAPTVLETVAYVAYLVPVLTAFLWPARRPIPTAADRAESSPPGPSTSSTSSPEAPEHVRA
jgi:high-affinity iron transporter